MDNTNSNTHQWSFLGQGSIFAIGGGELTHSLPRLVRALGGPEKAKILIMTHASEDSDTTGFITKNKFVKLGVSKESVTWINAREPFSTEGFNCLFAAGGQQGLFMAYALEDERLARIEKRPSMISQIKDFVRQGGMLAGTSAGVPIIGQLMISGGKVMVSDCSLRYGPGLGIIPGVFFEQHFQQRGRHPRAVTAIAQFRRFQPVCIGLDEDTALHIKADGWATVRGAGSVHVFTAMPGVGTNLRELSADDYLRINFSDLLLSEDAAATACNSVGDTHCPGPGDVKQNPDALSGRDPDHCDPVYPASVSGVLYHTLGPGDHIDFKTWKVEIRAPL